MPIESGGHPCAAGPCTLRIAASKLMCSPHWAMVPPDVQKAVYATWARGIGAGSAGHRKAVKAAINAVDAQLAGQPPRPKGTPAAAKRCQWCPALIITAATERAKTMPLDPEPNPDGNVAVHADAMGNLHCRVLRKGEEPLDYETRYMPHWATCTRAGQARRRKPATNPAIKTPH